MFDPPLNKNPASEPAAIVALPQNAPASRREPGGRFQRIDSPYPIFWNTTFEVPLLFVTKIVSKPLFASFGTMTYKRLSEGIA